jgi:hypothetical protein
MANVFGTVNFDADFVGNLPTLMRILLAIWKMR